MAVRFVYAAKFTNNYTHVSVFHLKTVFFFLLIFFGGLFGIPAYYSVLYSDCSILSLSMQCT